MILDSKFNRKAPFIMIKKFALLCLISMSCGILSAEIVPLYTGHWILDRYRNVEIDSFDYQYSIYSIDHMTGTFELADGSIWHVEPMLSETKSFYKHKGMKLRDPLHAKLFGSWQPEDVLIFHKVSNQNSVLVYNVNRDQLLDVWVVSGPKYQTLQISSAQNTSVVTDRYKWDETAQRYINDPKTDWYTVIVLNDGSVWQAKVSGPVLSWQPGDPIHVLKDTPYWSNNTHILVNMKAKKTSANSCLGLTKLGVWQVSEKTM